MIIDGAVNGVAALLGGFGSVLSRLQSGFVRGYALSIVLGLLLIVAVLGRSAPAVATNYLGDLLLPAVVTLVVVGAIFVLGLVIAMLTSGRGGPGGPSALAGGGGNGAVLGGAAATSQRASLATRRLITWAVSLVLAVPLTYLLFSRLEIGFVRAGAFTIIAVILLAAVLALILDTLLKTGIYDEHGWHLGPAGTSGPLVSDDPAPPEGYQPIVSRAERLKRQK